MTYGSGFSGSRQDDLLWALDDGAGVQPTNPAQQPSEWTAAGFGDGADIFGASAAVPQPHPSAVDADDIFGDVGQLHPPAVDADDIFGAVPRPSRHTAAAPSRHPHTDLVTDPNRGPDYTRPGESVSVDEYGHTGGTSVPARGFVPVVAEELPSHDSDASDGEASWFRDNVFGSDQPAFETAAGRDSDGGDVRRTPFWRAAPGKVAGVAAAVAVVVAGVVYIPGMVSASPDPGGPSPSPTVATTPPSPEPATEPSTRAAPQMWEGGSVPGYVTAPTWTLDVGEDTARGMTKLGPVLVRPGVLALHDIVTGEQVFEAATTQAVVKTFAASAVPGGEATLFWVTGAGVDGAGVAVPGGLWWNSGGRAAQVALSEGCDVSAAGTQPLVTCGDGSVWWLQPDGALGKVPVGDGQVALGVVDGAAVLVDGDGFLSVELGSGTVSRLSVDAPTRDGVTLTPLRWLGMGAAGVVSVWGDPAAGMGGVVDVVLHDFEGAVTGQVSVQGSAVDAAQFGRGVGGARGFIGPIVVDLTGRPGLAGAVWALPDGCAAFDAAGVVTRVECGEGVGVDVAGQVWIGASGVAATSADGGWAVVVDGAGVMSGHARIG